MVKSPPEVGPQWRKTTGGVVDCKPRIHNPVPCGLWEFPKAFGKQESHITTASSRDKKVSPCNGFHGSRDVQAYGDGSSARKVGPRERCFLEIARKYDPNSEEYCLTQANEELNEKKEDFEWGIAFTRNLHHGNYVFGNHITKYGNV